MQVLAPQDERSDFSVSVLEAFRRRSKALSRRGATVECLPVKEVVDGQESSRSRTDVTIKYRVEGAHLQLRVHVWSDRWTWVDARRRSKAGWLWEYRNEGRFLGPKGARGLVELVEKTMDESCLSASDAPRAISAIWSGCLAFGPRSV